MFLDLCVILSLLSDLTDRLNRLTDQIPLQTLFDKQPTANIPSMTIYFDLAMEIQIRTAQNLLQSKLPPVAKDR